MSAVSVELGKEGIAETGVGGLGVEGEGGKDPSTLKLRRDRGERTDFLGEVGMFRVVGADGMVHFLRGEGYVEIFGKEGGFCIH